LEALEERLGSTFRFDFTSNIYPYDALPKDINLIIETNVVAATVAGNSGTPYNKYLEIDIDKNGNTSMSEAYVAGGDGYGASPHVGVSEAPAGVEKILKVTTQKAFQQGLVK